MEAEIFQPSLLWRTATMISGMTLRPATIPFPALENSLGKRTIPIQAAAIVSNPFIMYTATPFSKNTDTHEP